MLLPVKDCGKGVNKDMPASELALGVCSDASNAEFYDGFVGPRKGIQEAYTTPTVVPYFITTYNTATARFLVQCSTASVFVDDGGTRTDITGTPPTGARDDRWTGGDFNGTLILNNGVDDPMYWNGDTGTNLAALTGWPANYTAATMRPFKDYIVAGYIFDGTDTNPQMVMWSNAAEAGSIPTTWTAAATNDAGDDPFSGVGAIIDFLPLGDVNIVYGRTGRVAMQHIGGNQVFNFARLPGEDGLLAKGCVVQCPKGHVFLSAGDVMLHNGGDAVSIAQGWVRDWIFSTMDTSNAGRSFLTLNPQRAEVWIAFPSTGSSDCDTVAAWNWITGQWAIHYISSLTYGASGLVSSALSGGTYATSTDTYETVARTYSQDEFSSNQARLILATSTPKIGLGNVGSTDFGSTFTWYAEWRGIRPSMEDQLLVPRAFRGAFDGTAGDTVSVYLGWAKTAGEAPTYTTAGTHTQGTTNWVNRFGKRGRYLAVKVTGDSDKRLRLRSFELDVRPGGQF